MFPIKTDNRCTVLNMSQNKSSSQTSKTNLLCCRACLTTEGRLFNMDQHNLINGFSSVVGIRVIKDKLPQYLCSYCRTLMLKFVSFREMCVTIQKRLIPELSRGELNTQVIQKIHKISKQCLTLTSTDAVIVNCDTEVTDGIETPEDIDTEILEDIYDEEDIKYLENIDIQESNIDIKLEVIDDIEIEYDGKIDRIIASDEKDTVRIKKEKEVGTKLNVDKCDNDIDNVSSSEDANVATDNEEDGIIKITSANHNSGGDPENNLDKNVPFSNLVKDVKKETKETATNKAFEREYSVKIVVLSKEDQLAEMLARKDSKNYQESEYKCGECFKGFRLETTYKNHMLAHSPSRGAFSCEICHIRNPKKYSWQKHQAIHQLKIFCQKCQFVSRTRQQAMQHDAAHAGKTFACPHCDKTFKKSSTFFSHVRLVHPAQNVACELCGEMFVGQLGLKMHKARVHTEHIKCTVCSAKFANLAALNRHMDAAGEHTDLPCEQCGENCASEDALREHLGVMHPTESHLCEECDMSFPSALAYETHVLRKHRQLSYKKAGPRRSQLTYKGRQVHRVDRDLIPSSHMCEHCGKIMPNAVRLRLHQLVHESVKPFVCDLCQRGFTLKQLLIWHMRVHTGEKPFQCPECPRAFSSNANCKRHHKTVHLGVRGSFTCPICGSTVTTKDGLRVHIDAKHGGKGWPRSRKRNKNACTSSENKS